MIDRRTPQRIAARWRIWRNSGDVLRRRVAVEQFLFDCASGKRRPPTPEECRTLALKLGTPSEVQEIKLPKKRPPLKVATVDGEKKR